MSEMVRDRLRKSVGKVITIYLNNGFRYSGKLTGCDDEFVEILDSKLDAFKIINLHEVKDMEIEK